MSEHRPLREQLAGLPTGPGVYVYRDARDRVLYVGKAKSLRKRVLSYFQAPLRPDGDIDPSAAMGARSGLHPKIDDMVRRIARVEVLVAASENEAMMLEASLIKRNRPPFNIKLRDDKSYPYIAISLDEEYPRVYFTRERHRRDRMYFGPFSSASKVRETLQLIGKIFPSRPCEGREPGRPSGVPCLDYHIKRCLAPCVGYVSREEYADLIDQIIAFLSGRYRGLERELETSMRDAAAAQEFERAAVFRNRLAAVRHLMERQSSTESVGTADVLGLAVEGESANVQVLQVRDGVLQDRQSFFLDVAGSDDEATVLQQFALEYYAMALAIPPLVVLGHDLADGGELERLLGERRGRRVRISVPERGDKRALADMADRNALFALEQDRLRHEQSRRRRREALTDLQERLGLPAPPVRIECYDISNLGETHAVASMVVFEGGAPAKAHYRTFSMRYDGGPDDFARIREALGRRFARLAEPDGDPSFSARPGLVLIDGGKGQLAAGVAGMREAGVSDVPVASLAKREEEVYLPGRGEPLPIPRDAPGLRLLQHARDEAHRFALRHHRGKRGRGMTESILDALPGVGPARKGAILRHFGSPERFLQASRDDLAGVPGLPPRVARDIYERLHKTAGPQGPQLTPRAPEEVDLRPDADADVDVDVDVDADADGAELAGGRWS